MVTRRNEPDEVRLTATRCHVGAVAVPRRCLVRCHGRSLKGTVAPRAPAVKNDEYSPSLGTAPWHLTRGSPEGNRVTANSKAQAHALLGAIQRDAADDPRIVDGRPTEVWFHLRMLELAMLAADAVELARELVLEDRRGLVAVVRMELRLNNLCNAVADVVEAVPS